MSELLARLARTLTHRWKISAVGAFLVIVLIGIAAGTGGEAADDFSAPGTETQKAIDLFKAHSPAFAGADSTLVFNVDEGKITDPGPKAAVEDGAGEGQDARRASSRSATRSPRAGRSRPTAAWRRSTCATAPTRARSRRPTARR